MVRDDLLPPELLDGLKDLEWVGDLVARGLGSGIHRSPFAGRGEDFERHRPYQQGDDLRHLDWRLLARTDRLHVRRYRETSNLRTTLVVDATPSMAFPHDGDVTKLRFATLLAAAFGRLARDAGDLPGLALAGVTEGFLHPRPGREAWHALLHTLTHLAPGDPASLAPTLHRVGEEVRAGGRVVILSDFLEVDDGASVASEAAHLRARGDAVTAIRILSPEELGEGEGSDALYHDPEDPGVEIPGDPSRDPAYLERLSAYYGALSQRLGRAGVQWWEARTTDPLLPLLRSWLRAPGRGP